MVKQVLQQLESKSTFKLSFTCRMMLEAQEIFGLDFDPAEFEQLAREGVISDEEEDEEVCVGEREKGGREQTGCVCALCTNRYGWYSVNCI